MIFARPTSASTLARTAQLADRARVGQRSADIGSVLGFTLRLMKIERSATRPRIFWSWPRTGVSFANIDESENLHAERQPLSTLFAEAADLLGNPGASSELIEDYADRTCVVVAGYQAKIDACMTSERPGQEVVSLAIYYWFLRRIATELTVAVRNSVEPVPHIGYLEGGTVGTDD